MNFLLIANNDTDGVGQVAVNLSKGLNILGYKSKTLVLNKNLKDRDVFELKRSFIKRVFAHLVNIIKIDLKDLFGFGLSTIKLKSLYRYIDEADVIVIFTFYKIFSYKQLIKILKLDKKIILRPLDIEMASGGCHFNMDCMGFLNECKSCPKIRFPFKFIPRQNLLKKKEIINRFKPDLLVQNNYVKKLFDKSSIFKDIKKEVLYIGTNNKRSKLINKNLAKKKLNFKNDDKIILFATFNLSSYVKGGHLLIKALEKLDKDPFVRINNITLLTLGKKNNFLLNTKYIKWKHINTTTSNLHLNQIFRASNLMVCPSLYCFGPHIVEEALLNKLPVVAFDGGSSQDFIKNGKNGFLVKKYNINQFASSIKKVLIKNFDYDDETFKLIKDKCTSINEAKNLINYCK